jgi:hypothetical protein
MYSAEIRFRYEAAGREHTTDVLHFGQTGGSGDSSDAELLRLRYPLDSVVTVAWNPNSPEVAAAEPGFHSEALLLPGAGLAFLVPGIMCIVLYFGMSESNNAWFGVGLGMFAAIFATVGLAFLTIGLVDLSRARESQHWPQADGLIVYGKIDSSTTVSRTGNGAAVSSTSSGDHLIFRYDVNGRPHFNNVRLFGQIAADSANSAQEVAMLYPVGKAVTVRYSPQTPDLGVLETGIYNEAFWLPGAGAAFLLFGFAVFRWGIPALTRG